MPIFKFTVKEERTTDVFITAETYDEASEEAHYRYDNDDLFYSQFNDADFVEICGGNRKPIEEEEN